MCGTFSTMPTSASSCRPSRVRAISIFHVATSPEPRSAIKSFSVSSISSSMSSSSLSASQIRSAAFDPPFMSRTYTRSFDGSREKSLQVAFPPCIRCTFSCSLRMICPLCNAPFVPNDSFDRFLCAKNPAAARRLPPTRCAWISWKTTAIPTTPAFTTSRYLVIQRAVVRRAATGRQTRRESQRKSLPPPFVFTLQTTFHQASMILDHNVPYFTRFRTTQLHPPDC